jgi:hypothetical protein
VITLPQIAASVAAVGAIGGSALAVDRLYVAQADFKDYIEQQQMADEREYVRELKKDIREVQSALEESPGEEYLISALAEMIDDLCEVRPDDSLCEVDDGDED